MSGYKAWEIQLSRKLRQPLSDLELAELDLHELKYKGCPDSEQGRDALFACILQDFVLYLIQRMHIRNFGFIMHRWLDVLSGFVEISGFPEEHVSELLDSIICKDKERLIDVCVEAGRVLGF